MVILQCWCTQIDMMREQLRQLRNTLKDFEAQCRQGLAKFGIDEEIVAATITKAKSARQENKLLQSIHESNKAVESKQHEIQKRDVRIFDRLYIHVNCRHW